MNYNIITGCSNIVYGETNHVPYKTINDLRNILDAFTDEHINRYLLTMEIFPKDVANEIFETLFLRYQKISTTVANNYQLFFVDNYLMFSARQIINFIDNDNTETLFCSDHHVCQKDVDKINILYHCFGIRCKLGDKCDKKDCKSHHIKLIKGAKRYLF
jgi:hypothetical protein